MKLPAKLFPFRQTVLVLIGLFISQAGHAQLIDGLLGQRRSTVQVLLRPYRIIDYKVDREVHNIAFGIHQTVLFENDTCRKFYWAVIPEAMDSFRLLLAENGYVEHAEKGFTKDSLQLSIRPLESGKATLFIAKLSDTLPGKRDAAGRPMKEKKLVNMEAMPLLQQAILAEEKDTTARPPKDPQRHWIGPKQGSTSVLGWEK